MNGDGRWEIGRRRCRGGKGEMGDIRVGPNEMR